jgi:hypothetical protein
MHGKNMVARLSLASENSTAVLVMLRLQLWLSYPKVRVQHDGEDWIANSLEEWALECGLTVTQVKYAFELMRQKNLVKTTMLWHRKRWLMHACFTPRTRAILAGGEEQICPGGEGNIALGVGAKLPSLIEQGEKQGDSKETSCDVPSPEAHDPGTKSAAENEDMLKAKSVHDVVSMVKAQTILHKPDSVTTLEFIWKAKVAEAQGSTVVLKAKERGQLKLFIGLCPPKTSADVLKAVLDDWLGFTNKVEFDTGKKGTPAYPHIGFLLTHASVAVIYAASVQLTSTIVPIEQEAPKAQTAHKIPAVQLMALEDAPASYEETMAILNLKEE